MRHNFISDGIKKLANLEINKNVGKRELGTVISFDFSSGIALVEVDGLQQSLPVVGDYQPLAGDPVIVVTDNGTIYIQASHNVELVGRREQSTITLINKELYNALGIHIRIGDDASSLQASFLNPNFTVNLGKFNYQGNIIIVANSLSFTYDLSAQVDGDYYLKMDTNLNLSVTTNKYAVASEMFLLKVTKLASAFTVLDARPILNKI